MRPHPSIVGSKPGLLSWTRVASSQAVKCLTLRINQGFPSSTVARATDSIAVKARAAWTKACSRPLSLRHPSMSHSLARLNSLSTLHRLLNSSTNLLAPRTTKSFPTLRASLRRESLLTGMTDSAP